MNTADVRATVHALVAEIAECDPSIVEPERRLREDLGLDSLTSMELLSRATEAFGIDVALEDALEVETVSDVIRLISERARV